MVFKRRQKATARTESEEEEERAAVSARSGPASSAHHSRLNNCTEKLKIHQLIGRFDLFVPAWFCFGEVNLSADCSGLRRIARPRRRNVRCGRHKTTVEGDTLDV